MKMKKIITLMLTAMLVLSLAACGEKEEKPAPESESHIEAETENDVAATDTQKIEEYLAMPETESYVKEIAQYVGKSEFSNKEELIKNVDVEFFALTKLYEADEGVEGEIEGETQSYMIPKRIFDEYTEKYFGIKYGPKDHRYRYFEDTDEMEFFPAGNGLVYSSKINSHEIKDGMVVYSATIVDEFSFTKVATDISLTFKPCLDGEDIYLKLTASKIV